MDISKTIDGIKSRSFLLVVFDILFLVSPGVVVLFFFQRDVFLSLDWIKLILLSASITTPFSFLNTLFLLNSENVEINDDEGYFSCFSRGLMVTGTVFYLSMSLAYVISFLGIGQWALKQIIINIVIIQIIFIKTDIQNKKNDVSGKFLPIWGTSNRPKTEAKIEDGAESITPRIENE